MFRDDIVQMDCSGFFLVIYIENHEKKLFFWWKKKCTFFEYLIFSQKVHIASRYRNNPADKNRQLSLKTGNGIQRFLRQFTSWKASVVAPVGSAGDCKQNDRRSNTTVPTATLIFRFQQIFGLAITGVMATEKYLPEPI